MSRRALAWIALALFAASWFLPVHEGLLGHDGSTYGEDATLGFARGTPPGWRAVRMAWEMLVEDPSDSAPASDPLDQDWSTRVLGATCLTNFVMLLFAVLSLATGMRSRAMASLLLLCALHNASWIYFNLQDPEFLGGLQIGYYLWSLSFALAGAALLRPRGT